MRICELTYSISRRLQAADAPTAKESKLVPVFQVQPTPSQSGQLSFREIRERVYASPARPDQLPTYDGASDWETFCALFLSVVSDRIAQSMERTLAEASDFKDDRPKLFHPKT